LIKNYLERENSISVLAAEKISHFAGGAIVASRYAMIAWKKIFGDLPAMALPGSARIVVL
jgi:hypothetical protein